MLAKTFPLAEFNIDAFSACVRFDIKVKSRAFYVQAIRYSIKSFVMQTTMLIEVMSLKKRRLFLNESYNSQRNSVSIHLDPINSLVDEYIKIYDNFLFIGNFNVSLEVTYGKSFCNLNDLKSLIGAAVYFKNLNKPTCIDFILTNWSVFSANLSDLHLLAPEL